MLKIGVMNQLLLKKELPHCVGGGIVPLVGKRKRVLEQEFEEGMRGRWEGACFLAQPLKAPQFDFMAYH